MDSVTTVTAGASRRPLRAGSPEVHVCRTRDGTVLRLTRHRGGGKGPVLLTHGLGVSSRIFATDTIETNLLEHLHERGFDVWLLDYRVSIELESVADSTDADVIATQDYPAAVDHVRAACGVESIQVLAHCFGSTTFLMAMLAGLKGVRSAVCSQASTRLTAPCMTRWKAMLRVPLLLELLRVKTLTARVPPAPGLLDGALDALLALEPVGRGEACASRVCRRVTFLYSRLYEHGQLSDATHSALGELFAAANVRTLKHLTLMVRRGRIVSAAGEDVYLPHIERLAIPIRHIHGEKNVCFLPESSEEALDELARRNGRGLYDRVLVPGYGHIDCIFGARAARDVYPKIVEHLERT